MLEPKVQMVLLEALRRAQLDPAEQRLYRRGKLPGLFASRQGPQGEAALAAIREGLLEVVRLETKGRATMDWVRPTPKALDYLQAHDSPLQVLQEVRETLSSQLVGVPQWLAQMQAELSTLRQHFSQVAERFLQQVSQLQQRVEDSLRRLEASPTAHLPEPQASPGWHVALLTYLDRRRLHSSNALCPLPELFAALRAQHPELALSAFHEGLKQLQVHRALKLMPFTGTPDQMAQPEYALLEGATLLYYATRS